MTTSPSSTGREALAKANDLLYGFDICDEETRQYLGSLIASGQAPPAELHELRELSLMRGAEDWDLLFEPRQWRRDTRLCGIWAEGGGEDHRVATGAASKGVDGAINGVAESQTQCASPDNANDSVGINESSLETATREDRSPEQQALPNEPASPAPETKKTTGTERAVKATGGSRSPFFNTPTTPRSKHPKAEPTPPSTAKKPRPPRGTVSSLPIPPLSADRFGLIQEELADDPFRLLIAITFLIRTAGKAAIPVFWDLMERFPTPEALAAEAAAPEIVALIRPLGLSAVRCVAVQKYARGWLERPPRREVRYGVKNYPRVGDGRDVRVGEEFGPEDGGGELEGQAVDAVADARARAIGSAWEIGHLTQGPYALDSWRIFCRDVLLGRASHWTGKGNAPEFQPEWMRVLPRDKELRACLRWMWMREGWEWDPLTGEREPLREDMRRAVDEGRVGYDDSGNLVIIGE
ncbi:DNA glycosylase [Chaetomium sp. MPI-CAGE-AT-0009]|nr:DNA glycosylase [Chaetomium sp. MPI-CAGE-AT-0009]